MEKSPIIQRVPSGIANSREVPVSDDKTLDAGTVGFAVRTARLW
jgi:hypothetical protein